MATFGDMIDRIADEINRSDIDTNIAQAINTSIQFYRGKQFWFNQKVTTVQTLTSIPYSTPPVDFIYPITLKVTDNVSTFRLLEPMDWTELQARYVASSSTGNIYQWTYFADQFWWWLIPNDDYVVTLAYIYDIGYPASNDAEGPWFNEAEAMIRSRAKGFVYQDTLKDTQKALGFFAQADAWEARLKQLTINRSYNPKLVGHW